MTNKWLTFLGLMLNRVKTFYTMASKNYSKLLNKLKKKTYIQILKKMF